MRQKSLAKTNYKKLLRRAEELWKKSVRKRDVDCQVCSAVSGMAILQADHCFSRKIKELFLDMRNGTLLCKKCHTNKTYKNYGIDKKVDQIVLLREGAEFWKYSLETAFQSKAYKIPIDELEKKIIEFEDYLHA